MSQILQFVAIAAATITTGAATLIVMNEDIPDLAVPKGDWTATGALDGKTFEIYGSNLDSGAKLQDDIVFRDGAFQSTDCEEYCNFGWSDYQTKNIEGVIHFTATAVCPEAPHTVVWYGTVTGNNVVVDVTWTTRRWYWTHQMPLRASGSMVLPSEVTG